MSAFALALAAGLVVGLSYFWALWRTVARLVDSARPARLLATSLAARTLLLLAALYAVASIGWQELVVFAAGLFIARAALVLGLRPDAAAAEAL